MQRYSNKNYFISFDFIGIHPIKDRFSFFEELYSTFSLWYIRGEKGCAMKLMGLYYWKEDEEGPDPEGNTHRRLCIESPFSDKKSSLTTFNSTQLHPITKVPDAERTHVLSGNTNNVVHLRRVNAEVWFSVNCLVDFALASDAPGGSVVLIPPLRPRDEIESRIYRLD